jgi:hypothetical protein
MASSSKTAAIIGLTIIAVFCFWTIIVPIICAAAIIDMIEEGE